MQEGTAQPGQRLHSKPGQGWQSSHQAWLLQAPVPCCVQAKQLTLRSGLAAASKACADSSGGSQRPGLKDDGLIGAEVRLLPAEPAVPAAVK
jgi:hypothetical protein